MVDLSKFMSDGETLRGSLNEERFVHDIALGEWLCLLVVVVVVVLSSGLKK